jgi:RNA polymerase sigma factor (sigma-70 family)
MSFADESDESLLSAWGRTRDEAAFHELVRRHAGLVLGTARRRVESEEAAEEVMQNVFTALAKKASRLHRGSGLAGWLHRATVLESATMHRGEQRRVLRMKHLAANSTDAEASPEIPSCLLPLLDEAVNALPEAERRIILLHWYESRPFAEVASRLGISTDAAKKRGQRAMERLTTLIMRRGAKVTPAALMVMATASLTAEAPAALPVRVAGKAIAAAKTSVAGSTLSGLATGAKWGAAAAFAIGLAAPATIQWASAPQSPAAEKRTNSSGARKTSGGGAITAERNVTVDETPLQKLARALRRTPSAEESEEFTLGTQALIFALGERDLPEAQRLLESQPDSIGTRKEESKVAPALRLASYVECLFARWSELDEAAAVHAALTFANRDCRYAAWLGALSRMTARDPVHAVETSLAPPVPEEDRRGFAQIVICNNWFQRDPAAAMEQLRVRSLYTDGPLESSWMVRQWALVDQPACLRWLGEHYPDKIETALRSQAWELGLANPESLIVTAQNQSDGLLREDLLQAAFASWPERQPAEAARAFAALPQEARTESLARAVAPVLAASDPAAVRSLAASLPEGPARNAFDLAAVSAMAADNPQQAASEAMAREAGPARREALRRIASTWLQFDGPAAAAWIDTCADLADCRNELLETAP